jgi:hypothetical protein
MLAYAASDVPVAATGQRVLAEKSDGSGVELIIH